VPRRTGFTDRLGNTRAAGEHMARNAQSCLLSSCYRLCHCLGIGQLGARDAEGVGSRDHDAAYARGKTKWSTDNQRTRKGSVMKVTHVGLAILIGALLPAVTPAPGLAAMPLRIGYVHVFDDAPVAIAREKGFFAAEGLDAQVTMFTSGPTLVKGLISDQLDVGMLGFTNAVTWSAQGADLKIIGKVQEGYHSLIARGDRHINTLKDLKGKTIASQAAGSTADIVLKGVVLKSAGLTEKDVQLLYTAPSTALASLRAGRIDAAFLFQPYDSMARAALPVTEVYEVGKTWPFPCMVVIVPGRLTKEQPDAARKVLASIKRSVEFITAHPAEASRILAPVFMPEGELAADGRSVSAAEVMLKALKTNVFDWRLSESDLTRMDELAAIMKTLDILKKEVPINQVVDLRWQTELERRTPKTRSSAIIRGERIALEPSPTR
jgi:NitT/TauT family transport system substrate-binding protein